MSIRESFAELERQMLEEEDRGFRDDWDDMMWTLSDDDDELDINAEEFSRVSLDIERGHGSEVSEKRIISEEEKEHWKKRSRRI